MQYEYKELGQKVPSQWKLLPLHSKQKWTTTSEKGIIHMEVGEKEQSEWKQDVGNPITR